MEFSTKEKELQKELSVQFLTPDINYKTSSIYLNNIKKNAEGILRLMKMGDVKLKDLTTAASSHLSSSCMKNI